MKIIIITALTLFSLSAFAGNCYDLELKDNVEVCYKETKSIGWTGNVMHSPSTKYVIEYTCKRAVIKGSIWNQSPTKEVKKSYYREKNCKKAANNIETKGKLK